MNSCSERVFITAIETITPATKLGLPLTRVSNSNVKFTEKKLRDGILFQECDFDLDQSSPLFPSLRDAKSMRMDVVAVTMCLGKIFQDKLTHWSLEERATCPIFTGTSSSESGMGPELAEIFEALFACDFCEEVERNQKIFARTHPLFALKVLTNSAQAYAAQLFGFRESNTTFGSTSHDTFYALQEAVDLVRRGQSNKAVVCASNGGGIFSLLMNRAYDKEGMQFRESPAAVALALESETAVKAAASTPLVEVVSCEDGFQAPILSDGEIKDIYKAFSTPSSQLAIFSGGVSDATYRQEQQDVQRVWTESWSLFPTLGSVGTAAVLLNVAAACEFLQSNQNVDCLDCDVFGRQSRVRIGRP